VIALAAAWRLHEVGDGWRTLIRNAVSLLELSFHQGHLPAEALAVRLLGAEITFGSD
jgi:hypothetical protein